MRTVIPGTVSAQYIKALYDNQKRFLDSITASPEDTIRYKAAWPDWVAEAEKRDRERLNGTYREEHPEFN